MRSIYKVPATVYGTLYNMVQPLDAKNASTHMRPRLFWAKNINTSNITMASSGALLLP